MFCKALKLSKQVPNGNVNKTLPNKINLNKQMT